MMGWASDLDLMRGAPCLLDEIAALRGEETEPEAANSTSPANPPRERTITLTVEQWSDVVSALYWTQREILTEGSQRAAFPRWSAVVKASDDGSPHAEFNGQITPLSMDVLSVIYARVHGQDGEDKRS